MGRGINKVILIGNLGADPEVRFSPSGMAMTNLSLATSENWKDKNTGQPQERTEWHRIVLFGRLAEICGEYLKKGSKIYIEGSLRTRKWQDKTGQERYITEIVGSDMQMVDSKRVLSSSNDETVNSEIKDDDVSVEQKPLAESQLSDAPFMLDDDIPF